MSPAERRQELLEVLCLRRHDTYDNLAYEFNVSKMTIRRDVAVLMCSYPIETVHGGRHGCVRVMEGYYYHHKSSGDKILNPKQTALLRRLRDQLAVALAQQQASLEAYAEKQGFEIAGITVEQASGLDFSRRGLAEVSGAVAAGEADLLLVANLSRLGRNMTGVDAYLRWLEDQFVEVVCADGTTPQTNTEILLALMKESGISLDRVR